MLVRREKLFSPNPSVCSVLDPLTLWLIATERAPGKNVMFRTVDVGIVDYYMEQWCQDWRWL